MHLSGPSNSQDLTSITHLWAVMDKQGGNMEARFLSGFLLLTFWCLIPQHVNYVGCTEAHFNIA